MNCQVSQKLTKAPPSAGGGAFHYRTVLGTNSNFSCIPIPAANRFRVRREGFPVPFSSRLISACWMPVISASCCCVRLRLSRPIQPGTPGLSAAHSMSPGNSYSSISPPWSGSQCGNALRGQSLLVVFSLFSSQIHWSR